MTWQFYVIVGGSIVLALFISWLGKREEKEEQTSNSEA
jgi:hypothetical protein